MGMKMVPIERVRPPARAIFEGANTAPDSKTPRGLRASARVIVPKIDTVEKNELPGNANRSLMERVASEYATVFAK
jgi:hypothetical protein